jgi:hypothetical protein
MEEDDSNHSLNKPFFQVVLYVLAGIALGTCIAEE